MAYIHGLQIIIDDRLPKKETDPICWIWPAHPLIIWLSKWLPISPWVWIEGFVLEDQAFRLHNKLIMPSSMFHNLKGMT